MAVYQTPYSKGSFFSSDQKTLVAAADYGANEVMSESASAGTPFTLSDVVFVNGGTGVIFSAHVTLSKATEFVSQVGKRLFLDLYSSAPTCNLNDNDANTGPTIADLPNWIGRIEMEGLSNIGSTTADTQTATPSTSGRLPLQFKCNESSKNLYCVVTAPDGTAGTIAGSTILTVEITGYVE